VNLYLSVNETCLVRKKNQWRGDFTIMNKLNIQLQKFIALEGSHGSSSCTVVVPNGWISGVLW
jgi:hypothetical protein